MDLQSFVEAFGGVFEDSPWVAEATWPMRPFGSVEALHAAMTAEANAAPQEELLELLRAHPDLGTRARVSKASASEQRDAGLTQLTREQHERLLRLNAEYREKFGFPFLYAVKGSGITAILEALERRLQAAPEREFEEAMRQVCRIARFRLEEKVE